MLHLSHRHPPTNSCISLVFNFHPPGLVHDTWHDILYSDGEKSTYLMADCRAQNPKFSYFFEDHEYGMCVACDGTSDYICQVMCNECYDLHLTSPKQHTILLLLLIKLSFSFRLFIRIHRASLLQTICSVT